MSYTNLSEEQLQAMERVEGQTLLLAVPGSGKTTTLIARIGHMIYDLGIDPRSILVITFTKSAAEDMRARFAEMYQEEEDARRIDFLTINSFCYRVVLEYARLSGREKPADDTDSRRIIRRLFPRVYGKEFPNDNDIKNLAQQITFVKNMDLSEEEIGEIKCDDLNLMPMYRAYQADLSSRHCMDYDDQIRFARQLLANNTLGIRDRFCQRYQYIMVDEAQDTSYMQHQVIRLLTGKMGRLFMVGDEDQSIYGFRAAYPEALLKFTEFYPKGKVQYLQTNYRSAANIVKAADRLVRCNRERHAKDMLPARSEEGRVVIRDFRRRADQYQAILADLPENKITTAVLYRNNDSGLPLMAALEEANIPYACPGQEPLFFSNRVVQDAVNILRFALNPSSYQLIWKLYYRFDIRVRKAVVAEATKHMKSTDHDPILAAIYRNDKLSNKQRDKVWDLMEEFHRMRDTDKAWDALHQIRTSMGYKESDSEKLFLLESLSRRGESIRSFLARLPQLQEMVESGRKDPDSSVILTTIHGAKGLEFDRVVLIDAIEGILPSPDNDVEEERRIFYVGLTRAMDELVVYRYMGCAQPFLKEMQYGKGKVIRKEQKVRKTKLRKKEPARDYGCKVGDAVYHKKFGAGRILSLEGDIAEVRFQGGSVRKLSLSITLDMGIMELM